MITPGLVRTNKSKSLEALGIYPVLLLALLLAIMTRFYLLRSMPGWYADEGSDIDIAAHLMQGEVRYFAIGQSTLVAGRLPLFHIVLAGFFSLFGRDVVVLRALTASYGVLVTLLLFVLGRQIWGLRVALVAAIVYAVYPSAVLYSRLGFMYNQLALLYLLLFYCLWRFIRGGSHWWLAGACLSLSLALITNVAPLPMIGFVVLVLFLTRRAALWWAVPLIACFPLLYAGWMMAYAPQAFLSDLAFIMSRVGGSSGLLKIFLAVWNYKRLIVWDAWIPLGIFGLTRLEPAQGRFYTHGFFWYSLLFTVTGVSQVTSLGFHYIVPLFPWVAVGMAAFLVWALPRLLAESERVYSRLYAALPWAASPGKWNKWARYQGQVWLVGLAVFWILISPFMVMALQPRLFPEEMLFPELEQVTVPNIQEATAAVAYVNQRQRAGEVALAPPQAAWLVEGQVADFQQSAAFMGGKSWNYTQGVARDRFLFDCSLEHAAYVLVWSGWRRWAGDRMPDLEKIFQLVEENWTVVYEKGEWRVYANPESQRSP